MFRRGRTTLTTAVIGGLLLSTLASPALAVVAESTPPDTGSSSTAVASPDAAAAEEAPAPRGVAATRERAVVPLDVESVFALDTANSHPVVWDEGDTGSVRLAFPAGGSANFAGGYVQVFRAGLGPVGERWVGKVDVAATGAFAASETVFELPVGEYELFFSGFVSYKGPAVWSWLGGGYDASAATTLVVTEGLTQSIDMAVDGTASSRDRVDVTDRDGEVRAGATVTLFAAVDRNGRDELMPVSTFTSDDEFTIPKRASFTVRVTGFDRFADTWLGGVLNVADAEVHSAASNQAVQVTLIETPSLGVPLIMGTAGLGRELRVDHAMPRDGVYTYQWYADGRAISGRTSSFLKLTSSLAGKRISYRVGVTGWGMLPTSAMSLATPRVSVYGSPRVEGLMIPGKTMTLSPGTWPSGTKLSYQWLLNGFAISGATSTSLVVPADGSLSTITALVTAARPGYETVAVEADRDVGSYPRELHPISGVASEFPSGQQPGSIRGSISTIVQGGSTGVVGAHVQVYSAGTGLGTASLTRVAEATTDQGGDYSVEGLAPGNYCVWVDPPANRALQRIHFDCRNSAGGAHSGVRVFAGAVSEADQRLEAGETITGTVTSSTGAKVQGGVVSVYTHVYTTAGYLTMFKLGTTTTAATGRYSLSGLEGPVFYAQFAGSTSLSHKPQWWSGKSLPRSAAMIWVDPGKTATANATLSAYLPIGTPTISGTVNVGNVLTASHPLTSGATYSYQWLANGASINGATGKTLKLAASMEGKTISVRVTGTRPQYLTTTRTSAVTAKVLRSSAPAISGSMAVDRTLTVTPGAWTAGTALSYQWYRNGSPITDATGATYKLTATDRDDRLTVRVQGKKSSYATVARTSASTPQIAKITYPTIVGAATVGTTLTIAQGEWTPNTTFTYQWYANAAPISGATSATLRLTTAHTGAAIKVKVTGAKPGYVTFGLFSAATAPVVRVR